MDLWFGVPNANRVLHNLNIRLFADQITYVANHAEDEVRYSLHNPPVPFP
jgi:fatty-acyl-CoA synthase